MKDEQVISKGDQGVVVIGSGRFARALARSIPGRIIAIVSRNGSGDLASLIGGADIVGKDKLFDIDPKSYRIVWIATRDSSIADVAASLVGERKSWEGIAVVHSSGATSVRALDPLRERGALAIALHPNGSFTGASPIPPGLVWGVSPGDPDSMRLAREILDPLRPVLVPIDDERRGLYHAAASMAANFSVTLFAVAVGMYVRAGLSEEQARDVVAAFMTASAANARALGARDALTGPIARGDMEVVERQARALGRWSPEDLPLFNEMAMRTARLVDSAEDGDAQRALAAMLATWQRGEDQTGERGTPEAQSGQEDAS